MLDTKDTERLKFSPSYNADFTIKPVSFSAIAEGAKTFFNHSFFGAVNLEFNVNESRVASISSEGFALFYKTILKKLFGKGLLNISFDTNGGELIIISYYDDLPEFDSATRRELELIAELSGFSAEFSSLGNTRYVTAIISECPDVFLQLYAITDFEIHSAMTKIFFT